MLLVHLDGDALSVVPDADKALLCVDGDLDLAHGGISLPVVGCVHQDFVEDLVKPGYDVDVPLLKVVLVPDPEFLLVVTNTSDVSVRPE